MEKIFHFLSKPLIQVTKEPSLCHHGAGPFFYHQTECGIMRQTNQEEERLEKVSFLDFTKDTGLKKKTELF